jgi:sialidase-1
MRELREKTSAVPWRETFAVPVLQANSLILHYLRDSETVSNVKSGIEMSVEDPKQTHLFVSGKEGYHTYRIPAMVVSTKGTLLAFCEGRKYSSRDFGDIDIVLRRSFDSGKTWRPMQIVMDDGMNTIGNPSPVVDRDTGAIWLLFTENNMQVYVTNSVDDGATWSSPREITEDLESERWIRYGTGPCHGIQLKSGRLVTPCWRQVNYYIHYSEIVYSDDHGDTWTVGGTVGPYMDECTVVENDDRSLYLNVRNYSHSRGEFDPNQSEMFTGFHLCAPQPR